jgi:hypothetical protein
LGEQFEELQPVWVSKRFSNPSELGVQAVLESAMRNHCLNQVINRLIDHGASRATPRRWNMR